MRIIRETWLLGLFVLGALITYHYQHRTRFHAFLEYNACKDSYRRKWAHRWALGWAIGTGVAFLVFPLLFAAVGVLSEFRILWEPHTANPRVAEFWFLFYAFVASASASIFLFLSSITGLLCTYHLIDLRLLTEGLDKVSPLQAIRTHRIIRDSIWGTCTAIQYFLVILTAYMFLDAMFTVVLVFSSTVPLPNPIWRLLYAANVLLFIILAFVPGSLIHSYKSKLLDKISELRCSEDSSISTVWMDANQGSVVFTECRDLPIEFSIFGQEVSKSTLAKFAYALAAALFAAASRQIKEPHH